MITSTEIKKEATDLIRDVFKYTVKSDDKEEWKKAIKFIRCRIDFLEKTTRGKKMFVYKEVLAIMTNRFGIKFVKKK